MRIIRGVVALVGLMSIGLTVPSGAYAVEAARVWGTLNNSDGGVLYNSARLHQAEASIAGSAQSGGESAFRSVTTCGTCVTLSINGDNSSISGNSITSTNTGTITGTGIFY